MKIQPWPNIRPHPGQRVRVRLFMPQFHDAVREFRKRMTLRAPGKQDIRPGDLIPLRGWSGRPYHSPQIHLGVGEVTNVQIVRIWRGGVIGETWEAKSGTPELDEFARMDGFRGWADMKLFFTKRYDLPMLANAIQWKPAQAQTKIEL